MTKFNSGKITSSVILYNRGVPPNDRRFAYIASLNYGMLRQVARHIKQRNQNQKYIG
jgi:hypothetical protein